METWEVKEKQYFRKKLIYIRHYFPGVNIEKLNDEEFAIIANDAEWMHAQQIQSQQAKTLGLLS
ncbi:hypothetical protein D0T60_01625 [Bacteroides sp. 224]|nr:hypothetical protein [Bacteroides sp. 224]